MHTHIPVAMDEGIESQSIIPATGEVNHIDLRTEIMDVQDPTWESSMTFKSGNTVIQMLFTFPV